jgi:hypothetical protein
MKRLRKYKGRDKIKNSVDFKEKKRKEKKDCENGNSN